MFSKCIVVTKVSLEKKNEISHLQYKASPDDCCDLCRKMGIPICFHRSNGKLI